MAKQKRYSAQLKGQVVLESLQRKRPDAKIARVYGVHPITLAKWKKHFLENGSEVFGGSEEMKRAHQHQAPGADGGSEGSGDRAVAELPRERRR